MQVEAAACKMSPNLVNKAKVKVQNLNLGKCPLKTIKSHISPVAKRKIWVLNPNSTGMTSTIIY